MLALASAGSVTPALAARLAARVPARAAQAAKPEATSSVYDFGFYGSVLFGYESNYTFTTTEPAGSAIWAVEGGVDFKYRPTAKVRLQSSFDAMVRLPFADASLLEANLELPLLLFYRLHPRVELFLSSFTGFERDKAPPVFLDLEDIPQSAQAFAVHGTIPYYAIHETFRPAVTFYLARNATLEAGPYARIKQTTFTANPYGGDPDYRFFDVGGDVSAKLRYRDLLSARLRYDVSRRGFTNYPARPPGREPPLAEELAMTRHMAGLQLKANLLGGALQLGCGYTVRLVSDNPGAGHLSYVEHDPWGAVSVAWRELFSVSAGIEYLRRRYTDRTPCEAQETAPGSGAFVGADCTGVDTPARQNTEEAAIRADLRVQVSITSWMAADAQYGLERYAGNAEVSLNDHRVVAGVTFTR
jgi:hypothetical protein